MSAAAFLDTLRKFDLEHYYMQLSLKGITNIDALSRLTMQDYSEIGITSMDDRRKLFQLIQTLKNEQHHLQRAISPQTHRNASDHLETAKDLTIDQDQGRANRFSVDNASFKNRSTSRARSAGGNLSSQLIRARSPETSLSSSMHAGASDVLLSYNNDFKRSNDQLGSTRRSAGNSKSQAYKIADEEVLDTGPRSIVAASGADQRLDRDVQQTFSPTFNNSTLMQNYKQPRDNTRAADSKGHVMSYNSTSSYNLDTYGVPITEASYKNNTASHQPSAKPHVPATISKEDRIKVVVRKRPLSRKEIKKGEIDIVTCGGKRTILINEPKYATSALYYYRS